MTASEALRIDFDGRMDYAVRVERDALPKITELPDFASAYFDSAHNGELVVALTSIDDANTAFIKALMPDNEREVRLVQRSVTDAMLRDAMKSSVTSWNLYFPETHLISTSVDSVGGQLVFSIDAKAVSGAANEFARFESALGVPARLVGSSPPLDTVCTSRDNCVSPMRIGDRLYKGVIDSHNECTMAFVVYTNSLDAQFLTAGHCGFGGSNNWYHPGLPGNHLVGTDQATLYGSEGDDLMRIQMPDAQASNLIYAEPNYPIRGYVYPQVGIPVCTSRGYTNVISCGTVTSIWVRWYSNTGGYYVWGGDTNLPSAGGDSGSPIYQKVSLGNGYAVGTLSNTSGNFGLVYRALQGLGPLAIYDPGDPSCNPGPC